MNMIGFFIKLFAILSVFVISQAHADGGYLLGGGDKVRITVYPGDIPETISRISEDGSISFPTIGQVVIGGMTEREAEALLRRVLEENFIVQSPQVVVVVDERVSHQVSILGHVLTPGKYPILPGDTALDLIAQAGGITSNGGEKVIITRGTDKTLNRLSIDLSAVLQGGDVRGNIEVKDDDVIYIPPREVFYIYGEVNRPGVYPLQKKMIVMQALSVSGGISQKGTERGLKVQRKNQEGNTVERSIGMTEIVQPDDVLFVKEALF